MAIETSLLEQAYAVEESTYGTLPSVTSTDGIRHQELTLSKKLRREPSPEKRGTPDRRDSLPRRPETTWDLPTAFWEPSGTLGTVGYFGKFLKNLMGAQHAVALATTTAGSEAVDGATLTSVTGLAVGDLIAVTLATPTRREVTRVTAIAGSDVSWDDLSEAPASGAAVVHGATFKQASTVPTSLSIFKFHTAGGYKEAVAGAIVNRAQITFDGSREVGIGFSGPAANLYRTGFTQPGAHTTVGAPASGLVGTFYVDDAEFLIVSCGITIEANNELRNREFGSSYASGIISHADFNNVTVSLQFYLEDVSLIDNAEGVIRTQLRLLCGDTNGQMVAAFLPSVEFEIPTLPASGGPKIVTIEGVAYGTNGNDQIYLAEL